MVRRNPRPWQSLSRMTRLTPLLWMAFGAYQVLAFTEGLNLWAETHALVALLVFVGLLTIPIPYVGSLITSAVAIVGATQGWEWPMWQAYVVFLPFVALSVMVMGVSGTFDILTVRPEIRPSKPVQEETKPDMSGRKLARRLDRDWKPVRERKATETTPFTDAFAGYAAAEYADRILRPMAEADLAGPQFRMAEVFEGDRETAGEAVWWYRRASELGHRDAQFRLGQLLEGRAKKPEDNAVAVAWTRSAADQGHPDAQYDLARKFANGLGVPLDKGLAVSWYERAAAQGHLAAQIQLGLAYLKGDGARQDTVLGLSWLESAARSGEEDAEKKRDTAIEGQDGDRLEEARRLAETHPAPVAPASKGIRPGDDPAVAKVMSAAADAHGDGNYATARRLLEPLVAADKAPAQFALAQMDANGEGGPVAPARAILLLCRAGAAGHIRAQYEAGMAYLRGDGIAEDRDIALGWLRAAAEQGYDPAQVALSEELHNRGQHAEAAAWAGFAAQQGNPEAQYRLALALSGGDGIPRDDAKAVRWYRRAARQGHAQAQADLGFMHVFGTGAVQDQAEGVTWLRRAADQGHPGARYSLSILGALGRRRTSQTAAET